MDRLEKAMESLIAQVAKKNLGSNNGAGGKGNNNERKLSSVQCYLCRKFGHYKRDCQKYKNWLENKKKEENTESNQSLNKNGPGEEV